MFIVSRHAIEDLKNCKNEILSAYYNDITNRCSYNYHNVENYV